MIIKILKNVTNIVELAVKVEKSNCTRLHSRSKLIEIKHTVLKITVGHRTLSDPT